MWRWLSRRRGGRGRRCRGGGGRGGRRGSDRGIVGGGAGRCARGLYEGVQLGFRGLEGVGWVYSRRIVSWRMLKDLTEE